jgi:hypothetical protein
MASTYEPIATTTLGSAASTITFSSIPSTYTDLRLVVVCTAVSVNQDSIIRFNSDTGTNYSYTIITGNGSAVTNSRGSNSDSIYFASGSVSITLPTFYGVDIFSYAGSTNKTILVSTSMDKNGSGEASRTVGLWRNTAAITRIDFILSTANYAAGTTATLWGIKAA